MAVTADILIATTEPTPHSPRLPSMSRVALALIACLLTGCGTQLTADPAPSSTPYAPGPAAPFVLTISNQSPIDNDVRIRVAIDGKPIADQAFLVGNQHTWVRFRATLAPGRHQLVATSSTGVNKTIRFETHGSNARYGVLDYWNYADAEGRHFSWQPMSGVFVGD